MSLLFFHIFLFVINYEQVRSEPPIANRCNIIAKYFISLNYDSTNCPHETWIEKFRDVDPYQGKNLVNIGFNKGYNFALWASLWKPAVGVDVQVWHQHLKTVGITDCGMCNDCNTRVAKHAHSHSRRNATAAPKPLNIIGVEIQLPGINVVQNISNALFSSSKSDTVRLSFIHAAGSDRDDKIFTYRCGNGQWEGCSIVNQNELIGKSLVQKMADYDFIRSITVDQLVKELIANKTISPTSAKKKKKINPKFTVPDYILDILQVDTEGSDALLLDGAMNTLRAGMVRVLIFEYHENCPWAMTSLKKKINQLAELEYDCYFEGTKRVWKLTGCWDPLYEIYGWANVICVRRGDVWHNVLEEDFVVNVKDAVAGLGSNTGEQYKPSLSKKLPCFLANGARVDKPLD